MPLHYSEYFKGLGVEETEQREAVLRGWFMAWIVRGQRLSHLVLSSYWVQAQLESRG